MMKLWGGGVCAVGGDARGSSELAQQWKAVLEGDRLGATQPVGERGAARETDGGGSYCGPL